MIAFDFKYVKSTSIAETMKAVKEFQDQGEKPMIYSGGTEIITFARVNKLHVDAVIDIKGIAECNVLEVRGEELVIGAAVSLNKIADSTLFPLLGETVKQIADRTSRNKITIGGNMNSELMYREGILPLLVVDAKVKIAKGNSEDIVPLKTVFDKQMKLKIDECLVQVIIDASYIDLPHISIKRTKISKVGYPVVSVAAIVKDNKIRVAFSGACDYPFRSPEIEKILNDSTIPIKQRIEKAIAGLPSKIVDDIQGTREYRKFVLKNILQDAMAELGMVE